MIGMRQLIQIIRRLRVLLINMSHFRIRLFIDRRIQQVNNSDPKTDPGQNR